MPGPRSPSYAELKRMSKTLALKTKGFGDTGVATSIINNYFALHLPNESARWLDWKGQANCAAGAAGVPVITVVMTIITSNRACVLHNQGVGFAAGSAVQLTWDWFLSVNRQDSPADENLAGVYSIVSATLSDQDLQETFFVVPPGSTVEIRCSNEGIAIDLWARVTGWYL